MTHDIDTDVRGVQTTQNILTDVAGVKEHSPTDHQDSTDTGAIDDAATPHIRLLALRTPASLPPLPMSLCPTVAAEEAHEMLSSQAEPARIAGYIRDDEEWQHTMHADGRK